MQLFITIAIGVLCIAFIYFTFQHVNSHERADRERIKKLTKKRKK
jgi:hypothetical protein